MLHLPVEPAEHAVEAFILAKVYISHKSSPLPVGFRFCKGTHVMYCIFWELRRQLRLVDGCGHDQPASRRTPRAAITPEAEAWTSPRLTPAPSPMAYMPGISVSMW